MQSTLSLFYLPTAVALGALHAVEPGHAKTLTAAYLIGIKGTWRDAVALGLSVAATHSVVVVAIAAAGLWLGEAAFADRAVHWLQIGSAGAVILLGSWMLWRRWPRPRKFVPLAAGDATGPLFSPLAPTSHQHQAHGHHHHHDHDHDHGHDHDHDFEDDEAEAAHIRSHVETMPDYVKAGQRPSLGQIIAFGAAGGMIPCPASITVMLLALSLGKAALGFVVVLGFSFGLALTLVAVGVIAVLGVERFGRSERFAWVSRRAPLISAGVVVLSGVFALLMAH